MTEFTRLTVVGSARRAELVVPDDETLGAMLPRLMELLDEPAGPLARPLTLVRATGEQLDVALSAADQQLADGEQLRLVRADDAPPPPEVADVTDVVGDSYADRPGRWSATSRHALAAVTVGTGSCVALLVTPPPLGWGVAVLVALLLVAVAAGRLVRRRDGQPGHSWPAIAATAAAAGVAVPVSRTLLATLDLLPTPAVWAAVAGVLVWIVLGVGVGAGLRLRAAVPGSLAGAGLLALPMVLSIVGLPPERALAVTGSVAAVLCGLLPWYALASSGLTGLDDQVLAGRPSGRPAVLRTVDDAYRALSWTAVAVAVPLAAAAVVLVGSANPWARVLGLVLITLTALRTRAFPLVVQQLPLGLAALVATVCAARVTVLGLRAAEPGQTTALLLGLVVVVVVAAGVAPAPHHRARLRRFGNLLEALCVIALAPLLLGVFGVYADLLGAFG